MHPTNTPIVVSTFYLFTQLDDYEDMKWPLLAFCKKNDLKGTILLAAEGINSTISGTRKTIDALYERLKRDIRFKDLTWKESFLEFQPFERMKVRLKKEIVAMGTPTLDVNNLSGAYVSPEEWDDFISDPDVITIDTRNTYETGVGTFEGAVDPRTATFKEFPEWAQDNLDPEKHPKVAMFCTGGVRCEKSTAYLKELGFKDVYHLEGGILNYFAKTGNKNGKWQGDCFVFDDRVAVNDQLQKADAVICPNCNTPVTTDDLKEGLSEYGVKCRNCT